MSALAKKNVELGSRVAHAVSQGGSVKSLEFFREVGVSIFIYLLSEMYSDWHVCVAGCPMSSNNHETVQARGVDNDG